MTIPTTSLTRALVATSTGAGTALLARRTFLRWGASGDEATRELLGDQLLPAANLTATRAITIHRPPDDIWPWLVQLGQLRGGFYSYDFLENLVGCHIHSADRIVPAWQSIDVGAEVNLYPGIALTVEEIQTGRGLVLRGALPVLDRPAPYDFTWAFVLREAPNQTTRLVVRERYRYTRRWAPLLVEPVELISFLMTQKMLRGIRDRAQAAPTCDRRP